MIYTDPLGLWNADVHYNKTLDWCLEVFGSEKYAKEIAKADNNVDWSLWDNPVTGQIYHFDRNPDDYQDSRQILLGQHYNKAVDMWIKADKEFQEADKSNFFKMFCAFNTRENKRENALDELGKGLHALQDYYAHLDWGVWDEAVIMTQKHVTTDEDVSFDDPRYDLTREKRPSWYGGDRPYQYRPVNSGEDFGSTRFADTEEHTLRILRQFKEEVNFTR